MHMPGSGFNLASAALGTLSAGAAPQYLPNSQVIPLPGCSVPLTWPVHLGAILKFKVVKISKML
jgi:hypothetical protein